MHVDMSFIKQLGISKKNYGASFGQWIQNDNSKTLSSVSPINGEVIAEIHQVGPEEYDQIINEAQKAFLLWRNLPAPKRGEVVRLIGMELRKYKDLLGRLVTLEMGKLLSEGEGEVQEMIDIADFSVGLSRQLYGLTIQSERPKHRMMEQWHPLGIVGIVTAFNFPVAVWSWNALIAAACGDVMIWKPSSQTPLCAIAIQNIVDRIVEKEGLPKGVFNTLIGPGSSVGQIMLDDNRVPLVSFTGSTHMGRKVSEHVGRRLGKTILELGGNNAIIITESADLDLTLRAVLFGAVGTAGQRCTTTRRLIIHENIYDKFVERIIKGYQQITIGNPLEDDILMGPLVDKAAIETMQDALEQLKKQGGHVLNGGEIINDKDYQGGFYVTPCIAEAENDYDIVQQETFAPILYVMKYKTKEEALFLHNSVPQGLSSSMFTNNLKEAEYFVGPEGSDCGIANINIGTSGAEIGGAFGGEKETGGGRESGSDSWKAYMRRQTNTINYGDELPLAQGIKFGDI
jgi:aldehyde dehydrogenase (NAD+)